MRCARSSCEWIIGAAPACEYDRAARPAGKRIGWERGALRTPLVACHEIRPSRSRVLRHGSDVSQRAVDCMDLGQQLI
jgi:hypothetical protein